MIAPKEAEGARTVQGFVLPASGSTTPEMDAWSAEPLLSYVLTLLSAAATSGIRQVKQELVMLGAKRLRSSQYKRCRSSPSPDS